MGRVGAVSRALSPSLIGAKLLEHYIVTLDTASGNAYFSGYNDKPYNQATFGFTLAFTDSISVAAVWDNSPAAAAGLKPGMALLSINGKPADMSVEGLQSALAAMQGQHIELGWQGGSATLEQKQSVIRDQVLAKD